MTFLGLLWCLVIRNLRLRQVSWLILILKDFVIRNLLQSEIYLRSRLQRNSRNISKEFQSHLVAPVGILITDSFGNPHMETSQLIIWTTYSVHRFTTTASNGLLCGRIVDTTKLNKTNPLFRWWDTKIMWHFWFLVLWDLNLFQHVSLKVTFVNSCTFGKNLDFFGIARLNFS